MRVRRMKKLCLAALCVASLVLTPVASMAQEPVPTLTVPSVEAYGGFVVTSPDYGAKWSDFLLYGFEGGVSKGLTQHLWVTASFDFVFGNPSIPNEFGVPTEMHIKQ